MEYCIDNYGGESDDTFEDIKIKGYYSVDKDNTVRFDCSQLRYYIPPEKEFVHFDLINKEWRVWHGNSLTSQAFNNIMRWINKNYASILANPRSGRWLYPKFILDYATLIRLLRAPIDEKDGWVFCAAKWKGNIYVRGSPLKPGQVNDSPFRSTRYVQEKKFRQHMASDTANGSPMVGEELDGNSEFFCIFQSRLGDHTILYPYRILAVCSDETLSDPLPLDKLKFIELKLNAAIDNAHRLRIFREYRYFTWWSSIAPSGIDTVMCGFKNNDGIVNELRKYHTNDFSKICKRNKSRSIHFCNDFLYFIENTVRDDYNQTIYKFEKIKCGNIEVTEVLPFSEYSFLPEWYTRNID